jgi:hypothetical protein
MNEAPSSESSLATVATLAGLSPVQRNSVDIWFDVPTGSSRFWAIPFLGILLKYIILIPHLLIVGVLGMVVSLLQVILWIPVLCTGKYPDWAFDLATGYLRWSACAYAYFLGLTDKYPLFQLGEGSGLAASYPIQVKFGRQTGYSRLWAIPAAGLFVKLVILIPHFLILYILGLAVAVLQWVLWIPVLFTGRFPAWGYGLVAGHVRWYTRVTAYILGVTDQYPPFALN